MDFINMRKTGDICRLCLATDIRMHAITNTVLQNVYEKIANIKVSTIVPSCFIFWSIILFGKNLDSFGWSRGVGRGEGGRGDPPPAKTFDM